MFLYIVNGSREKEKLFCHKWCSYHERDEAKKVIHLQSKLITAWFIDSATNLSLFSALEFPNDIFQVALAILKATQTFFWGLTHSAYIYSNTCFVYFIQTPFQSNFETDFYFCMFPRCRCGPWTNVKRGVKVCMFLN